MEQREPKQAPILVAFNALADDREPVEFGVAAQRVTGASLLIVSRRDGEDDVAGTLDELRQDLERRGIDAEVRVHEGGNSADMVLETVAELHPGLVVLGSTRRSKLRSALRGTTIEPVIQKAGCPVAIVPHGYQPPPEGVRRIGVAYAPTHEGRSALRFAAEHHRAPPSTRPRPHHEQVEGIGHADNRVGGVAEHDVGVGVEVLRKGGQLLTQSGDLRRRIRSGQLGPQNENRT